MTDKPIGIEKAAERLKKKLKVDKVTLDNYKLSDHAQKTPLSQNGPRSNIEERHSVKRNKCGYYLSNAALETLQKIYIARLSENKKTDKSSLICEAIDLLYAKQNRRKSEPKNFSEQPDFLD